jgi:hypothetical protein
LEAGGRGRAIGLIVFGFAEEAAGGGAVAQEKR